MPFSYNDGHENLLKWTGFTDAQRETLKRFDEWLQLQRDIKISTRYLYLQRLKMFVKNGYRKSFDELQIEDVTGYLLKSKSTTRPVDSAAFKVFTLFLDRKDVYGSFKTFHTKLKEPEYLTEGEVKRLLKACKDAYERAYVSFLYDSGARLGELRNVKVKDLLFDEHGARVRLDGKTGPRSIRLVLSVPDLQQLLNHHPAGDNPEAVLFYGLNPVRATVTMSALAFRLKLKRIAQRAGIKKNVYPHMLRHSAVTECSKGMTDRMLIERFGWRKTTGMLARYSHVQMRDADNQYLELKGKQLEKQERVTPEITVVECLRCGEETESVNKFCPKCGLPVGVKEAVELDERDELWNQLSDLLRSSLERNPALLEKFQQFWNDVAIRNAKKK